MAKALDGLLCRHPRRQREGLKEAYERDRANGNVPNRQLHRRRFVVRKGGMKLDRKRTEEPFILGKRSARIHATVDGAV